MDFGKKACLILLVALTLTGCTSFFGVATSGFVSKENVDLVMGSGWKGNEFDPDVRYRFKHNLVLDDDLREELGYMSGITVYEDGKSIFVAEENGILILEFRDYELVGGKINMIYERESTNSESLGSLRIETDSGKDYLDYDSSNLSRSSSNGYTGTLWTKMVKKVPVPLETLEKMMYSEDVRIVAERYLYGDTAYDLGKLCPGTLNFLRILGKQKARVDSMERKMEAAMMDLAEVIDRPQLQALDERLDKDMKLAGEGEDLAFRSRLFEMKPLGKKPEISLLVEIPLEERAGSTVVLMSSDKLYYALTVGEEDMTEEDGAMHASIPLDDEILSIFGRGDVAIWQGEKTYETGIRSTLELSEGDRLIYDAWEGKLR